jgi:hypothetical protein
MGKSKATAHLGKKKERKETQMPECDTQEEEAGI